MATYVLPNIVTGQSITVQGNSLAQAQQNAASATGVSLSAQQGGGTFGGEGGQGTVQSGGSSGVSPGGGGSQTVGSPGQQTQNPGAGLDALLQAAQRGDKETFEKTLNEQIREWDQKYGLDIKQFDENIRQYNQNFLLSEAGVTGYYRQPGAAAAGGTGYFVGGDGRIHVGMPTGSGQAGYDPNTPGGGQGLMAAAGWAPGTQVGDPKLLLAPPVAGATAQGVPTMAREQQTYAQQMGMISQAAALQANPFRQQQAIGQMGNLLGGQGVAGFSAPNTVAGVGVAGGNTQGGLGYLSQMIQDIRDPTANTASMNQVLAGIPTPNKLNSNEFLRAAPSTQSMVLQGMQEKYGIDPNDALAQIKNTLPQFQAPTTVGTVKR